MFDKHRKVLLDESLSNLDLSVRPIHLYRVFFTGPGPKSVEDGKIPKNQKVKVRVKTSHLPAVREYLGK